MIRHAEVRPRTAYTYFATMKDASLRMKSKTQRLTKLLNISEIEILVYQCLKLSLNFFIKYNYTVRARKLILATLRYHKI